MAYKPFLPKELVDQILVSVGPEDIESFTLACQQWRACGLGRLIEHRALRKEYYNFQCDSTMDLLDKIILNPSIGLYLRHLKIGGRDYGIATALSDKGAMERFVNAAVRLVPAKRARSWKGPLRQGDMDPLISLLLLSLHELSILEIGEISSPWHNYDFFYDTLDRIADPNDSTTTLRKLQTVKVYTPLHSNYGNRDPIQAFARLPSVRTINARGTYTLSVNSTPQSSNVTTLYLSKCSIAANSLAIFKTLENFSLRGGPAYNKPAELTIMPLRDALEKYQKFSLRSLTLRSGSCFPLYMGSLRKLCVLSTLETEINLLLPLHAFDRLFYLHSSIIGTLPESLEELRLHINLRYRLHLHLGYKMTDHQLVSSIIKALAMAKGAGQLQKLRHITIIIDCEDHLRYTGTQHCIHACSANLSHLRAIGRCGGEGVCLDFELFAGDEGLDDGVVEEGEGVGGQEVGSSWLAVIFSRFWKWMW